MDISLEYATDGTVCARRPGVAVRHECRPHRQGREGTGPFARGAFRVAKSVGRGQAAVQRRFENEIEDEDRLDSECCLPFTVGGQVVTVCRASEVPDFVDDWIWKGRVRSGHVTAIVGPRGAAKSLLVAEIAARLSNGEPWPDDPAAPSTMAETLIITGEDEVANEIKPRLRAAGADLTNIHLADFRQYDGTPGRITINAINKLIDTLELGNLKLIVIDPFGNLVGQRKEHREEVRTLLHQLKRLASALGLAIILVNATDAVGSAKTGRNDVDVVSFLHAGARAVWTVDEDPAQPGRYLWLCARNNLAGGRTGLAFRIDRDSGRIAWETEPVELRPDDVQPTHRRATKVACAGDWLRGYLHGGARTSLDVQRDAALAGISRGVLYDAKGRLGVLSAKTTDTADGPWDWSLPDWCRHEKPCNLPQDSKISTAVALLSEAIHRTENGGEERAAAERAGSAAVDGGSASPPAPPFREQTVSPDGLLPQPETSMNGLRRGPVEDSPQRSPDRRKDVRKPHAPRSARRKSREDSKISGSSAVQRPLRVDIVRPSWITGEYVDPRLEGSGPLR